MSALSRLLDAIDPAPSDLFVEIDSHELMVAWRRDIDSEPFPELVDVKTAQAVIRGRRCTICGQSHAAGSACPWPLRDDKAVA